MKSKSFIILISAIICLTSCGKIGASQPEYKMRTLLPGECLASPELSYYRPEDEQQQVVKDGFVFGFLLDVTDFVKEDSLRRHIPSEDLFNSFGENRQSVKMGYERIYEDFRGAHVSSFHSDRCNAITILYNGGISLTADKEFAGRRAGENLGDLIAHHPHYDNIVKESGTDPILAAYPGHCSYPDKVLGIPADYICLIDQCQGNGLPGVSFCIPMGDYNLVKEQVTFELQIPVKVVRYLTWINDRLSNPNAPVPYEDEVLHCRFTTNYGLK